MSRPRRNFYASGRMSPAYRVELLAQANAGALDRRYAAEIDDPNPRPTTAELLALALAAGLDAYIVPSHGRLMARLPSAPYPTEIRSTADIERLAAHLPSRAGL
jgi:hypothetical protein